MVQAQSQSGSTLIEVLVIVAITGLISGLLFPRLETQADRAAFQQMFSKLDADIRAARNGALRSDTVTRVTVTPDHHSYVVNRSAISLPGTMTLVVRPGPFLLFFADGRSNGGVMMLEDGHRRAQVSVDGDTGLIASRHL